MAVQLAVRFVGFVLLLNTLNYSSAPGPVYMDVRLIFNFLIFFWLFSSKWYSIELFIIIKDLDYNILITNIMTKNISNSNINDRK